jgi:hypothetical protein
VEPGILKLSRSAIFDWIAAWPVWLAALWWGSLTALGLWIVPTLFGQLPSKALAGNAAAALFGIQSLVSAVLGAGLLLASRADATRWHSLAARDARGLILAGMLLALLLEFAVAPRISARINLPLWHGLGTAMLLLQWGCAAAVFWKLARPIAPVPAVQD